MSSLFSRTIAPMPMVTAMEPRVLSKQPFDVHSKSNACGIERRTHTTEKDDIDAILELGVLHYPLDTHGTGSSDTGTNTIRALADMFTCSLTSFPLVVGLFSGNKQEDHLSKLANELNAINNLENKPSLKFDPLLFLFPLTVSIFFGYIVGMMTNWQIGLSIGNVGMFTQTTVLVIVIVGTKFFNQPRAVEASHRIAKFLAWLRLLLKIAFCYAKLPVDKRIPVRSLIVYHRLSAASTPNFALFSMLEKMWTELIRLHGELPVRFQSCFEPPMAPRKRFKRLCCLPTFVIFIAFWIAFMMSTGILRYNYGNVGLIFSDGAITFLFVLSSTIVFLSLFGYFLSLCRVIKGLLQHPVRPLRVALSEFISGSSDVEETKHIGKAIRSGFLERRFGWTHGIENLTHSTSLKNLAINAAEERIRKADLSIREEFGKVCKLLGNFDGLLHQYQTRFIVCLDAGEIRQRDSLAKFIYQIHSLLLCEFNSPVAIVMEADFKVLLGEMALKSICPVKDDPAVILQTSSCKFVPQILSDNLHLVHTSVHLPIYFDSASEMESEMWTSLQGLNDSFDSISKSPNGYSSYRKEEHALQNASRNFSAYSRESRQIFIPTSPTDRADDIPAMTLANSQNVARKSRQLSVSRSSSNVSKLLEATHGIAVLYLKDHELADWNKKVFRQLVVATAFTSRLLKLCNLDVALEDLIFWITLVHYWPYHTAWLIIVLEQYFLHQGPLDKSDYAINPGIIDLVECFSQVKYLVSHTAKVFGPLITDDRDLSRLDAYLQRKPVISNITAKKLMVCVRIHNPYIIHCIRSLSDHPICHRSEKFVARNPQDINLESLTTQRQLFKNKLHLNKSQKLDGVFNREEIRDVKTMECLTMTDVCYLVSKIPNISPTRLQLYQDRVALHGVDGRYISVTDPKIVQKVLTMNDRDWHYMKRAIYSTRHQALVKLSEPLKTADGLVLSNMYTQQLSPYVSAPAVAIRQTPWLSSPQVPTGTTGIEGITNSLTDPMLLLKMRTEQEDTQTSLSGMEEPESLWTAPNIQEHRIPTKNVLKSVDSHIADPCGRIERGVIKTAGPVRRQSHTGKGVPTNIYDVARAHSKVDDRYSCSHKYSPVDWDQLKQKPVYARYNSKSTVDLRNFPENDSLIYRNRLHSMKMGNSSRNSSPRQIHYQPVYVPVTHAHPQGKRMEHKHPELTSDRYFIRNIWAERRSFEREPLNSDEVTNLRKMRKRPCHRRQFIDDAYAWYPQASHFIDPAKSAIDTIVSRIDPRNQRLATATLNERQMVPSDSTSTFVLSPLMLRDDAGRLNVARNTYIQTDYPGSAPVEKLSPTEPKSLPSRLPCTTHSYKRKRLENGNLFRSSLGARLDYVENESNSDHEGSCTCNYLYELEACNRRMVSSEPTLRDYSDELSSSTLSPDELEILGRRHNGVNSQLK